MSRGTMMTGLWLALAALLGLATVAAAQPAAAPEAPAAPPCLQMDPDADDPDPGDCGPLARLDLTEEQQQAIAKLRDEGRKERLASRKELRRLRHDLRGVMLADKPDVRAAEKLIGQIADLRAKMQVSWLRQHLAVRQLLTPEQRDQLPLGGPGWFDGRDDFGGRGGRGGCGGCGGPGWRGHRAGRGPGWGPCQGCGRDPGCGPGRGPGRGLGWDGEGPGFPGRRR